jgi:flagellar protein FliO/FliZ
LTGLVLGLPLPALAEPVAALAEPTAAKAGAAANVSVAGQLSSLVIGLVLVLGLIFVLAWVVKRMQRIGPASGQAIKLVASQALSTRDRLLLVQVGEEQILLGLTPGRISALHVLKEPVPITVTESATPEFAQRLMELLGKDHKDKS